MAENNTADVSNVKGVQGGYGFSAPLGTDWGTEQNPYASLGGTFENMGFISSDGIEESIEADTEEITDMNGDVVYVVKSKETETLTFTLISVTQASLSEWYGHDNVSASATDYYLVTHTSADHDQRVYVFELLLKDGRKWRKAVPNGQVTEVGSIVHASGEVVGREITVTCSPDEDGVRVYDYIEKESSTTTA